jgi:hypothetical protein
MKIPYKVIDGIVYVDAQVEVTEHFLNNVPFTSDTEKGGHFIMDHVRSGKATRAFGDVALVFHEENTLPIPPAVSTGIYSCPPIELPLSNIGDLYVGGPIQDQRKADIEKYYKAITELLEKKSLTGLGGPHITDEMKDPSPEEWDKIREKIQKTPLEFKTTVEGTLIELGFQKRGACLWHHVLFGEDREDSWMKFDPKTDVLTTLIPKIFRMGHHRGVTKVRRDIKTALDMPLL